jgi:decaprenylphospho-beta-D-erythro-pentofuranosid-2-ulose 2-reductase
MRDSLGDVQSVLVLGGTSELAAATLDALVRRRVRRVVLAVRDLASAEPLVGRLTGAGVATTTVAFDAEAMETHADFVDRVWSDGDIDLVLLAFGVLGDQSLSERSAADALHVVRANFDGAVSVLVPIVERMRHQGHGTVAVISSVAAVRPRRANFVYGAAKAGLDAFANGLADACVGSGVHVMVVRPGFVHTRMTAGMEPAPFATTPDVVADAILDGIRRNATIVYAPSVLRFVAPVLQMLPRAIWRRMPG